MNKIVKGAMLFVFIILAIPAGFYAYWKYTEISGERCLVSLLEFFPQYPNVVTWEEINSGGGARFFESTFYAGRSFSTNDNADRVFEFYRETMSQKGWEELDDGTYKMAFKYTNVPRIPHVIFQKKETIARQKKGVVTLELVPDTTSGSKPIYTAPYRFHFSPACKYPRR